MGGPLARNPLRSCSQNQILVGGEAPRLNSWAPRRELTRSNTRSACKTRTEKSIEAYGPIDFTLSAWLSTECTGKSMWLHFEWL
jgi:hypothetical protein